MGVFPQSSGPTPLQSYSSPGGDGTRLPEEKGSSLKDRMDTEEDPSVVRNPRDLVDPVILS